MVSPSFFACSVKSLKYFHVGTIHHEKGFSEIDTLADLKGYGKNLPIPSQCGPYVFIICFPPATA